jgi:UDP-N-acetylmuramoylalanine-D-glutamate ligase
VTGGNVFQEDAANEVDTGWQKRVENPDDSPGIHRESGETDDGWQKRFETPATSPGISPEDNSI